MTRYRAPVKHDALTELYCSVARTLSVLDDARCARGIPRNTRFDGFHSWLGVGRTQLSDRLAVLVGYYDLRSEYAANAW